MELIRRKTDYALRCLTVLAQAPPKKLVSVHYLAQTEKIPQDLLHKIMQALGRAKLVRATRGRSGGSRLARAPEKITVLRVLETLQGPFVVNRCFFSTDHLLPQELSCLQKKFVAIQEELISFLSSVTIADLVHRGSQSPSQT